MGLAANEFRLLVFKVALAFRVSTLTVLSQSRIYVLNAGESVMLECIFSADQFNLFDHPVMWRKKQRGEDTPMNIMSNINEPFMETGRFAVKFTPNGPLQYFQLFIEDLKQEDSGNYTCEIRGPNAILLGHVSYILLIRAYVDRLYITTSNSTSEQQHAAAVTPQLAGSKITVLDTQSSSLRCLSEGGYQSPEMSMYLDGRDITKDFSLRYATELEGVRGLRQMRFTTELFSYSFRARAEDNGKTLECLVAIPGLPTNFTTIQLNVQYAPQFSCSSAKASIGDKNVAITCSVRANPRVSSSFWIVDENGTTLNDRGFIDDFWSEIEDKDEDTIELSLYIKQTVAESFRMYSLVALNDVGSSTCYITLHKEVISSSRIKNTPLVFDMPRHVQAENLNEFLTSSNGQEHFASRQLFCLLTSLLLTTCTLLFCVEH